MKNLNKKIDEISNQTKLELDHENSKQIEGEFLKPKVEQVLMDIDSDKIKLTSYSSAEEYLKHVKEVLEK